MQYYRKKNKHTQESLASLLGVKNNTISQWEKGVNSIDIDTLHRVCEIFEVDLNDMFGVYSNSTNETLNKYGLPHDEEEVLSLYRQLDNEDKIEVRAELRGITRQMLKAEKYQKEIELKNA